jgi:hypothetical protein
MRVAAKKRKSSCQIAAYFCRGRYRWISAGVLMWSASRHWFAACRADPHPELVRTAFLEDFVGMMTGEERLHLRTILDQSETAK